MLEIEVYAQHYTTTQIEDFQTTMTGEQLVDSPFDKPSPNTPTPTSSDCPVTVVGLSTSSNSRQESRAQERPISNNGVVEMGQDMNKKTIANSSDRIQGNSMTTATTSSSSKNNKNSNKNESNVRTALSEENSEGSFVDFDGHEELRKTGSTTTIPRQLYDKSTLVSEMSISEEDFFADGCKDNGGILLQGSIQGSSLSRGMGFYEKSGKTLAMSDSEDENSFRNFPSDPDVAAEASSDRPTIPANDYNNDDDDDDDPGNPTRSSIKSNSIFENSISGDDLCGMGDSMPLRGDLGHSLSREKGFYDKSGNILETVMSIDGDSNDGDAFFAATEEENSKEEQPTAPPRQLYDKRIVVSELTSNEEDFGTDDGKLLPQEYFGDSSSKKYGLYEKYSKASDAMKSKASFPQSGSRQLYDKHALVSELTIREEDFMSDEASTPSRENLGVSMSEDTGFFDKSGEILERANSVDLDSSMCASLDKRSRSDCVPRQLYDKSTAISEMTITEEQFLPDDSAKKRGDALSSSFSKLFGVFGKSAKDEGKKSNQERTPRRPFGPMPLPSKARMAVNRRERLERRIFDTLSRNSDHSITLDDLNRDGSVHVGRIPRSLYERPKSSDRSLATDMSGRQLGERMPRRLSQTRARNPEMSPKNLRSEASLSPDDLGRSPRRIPRRKNSDTSLCIDDLSPSTHRTPRRTLSRSKNSEFSLSFEDLASPDPNVVDGVRRGATRRNSRRPGELSISLGDFSIDTQSMEGSQRSSGSGGMSAFWNRRCSLNSTDFPDSDLEESDAVEEDAEASFNNDVEPQPMRVRFHPRIERVITYEGPKLHDYPLLYYNPTELQEMLDEFKLEESKQREQARQIRHSFLRQVPDSTLFEQHQQDD